MNNQAGTLEDLNAQDWPKADQMSIRKQKKKKKERERKKKIDQYWWHGRNQN